MKFEFKIPTIKLSLLLFIILALVVAGEIVTLYKVTYYEYRHGTATQSGPDRPAVQLNKILFNEMVKWIEDRKAYQPQELRLTEGDRGRENPFAEYR